MISRLLNKVWPLIKPLLMRMGGAYVRRMFIKWWRGNRQKNKEDKNRDLKERHIDDYRRATGKHFVRSKFKGRE